MAAPVVLVSVVTAVLTWLSRLLILRFIAALGLGVISYHQVGNFFDYIRKNIQSGYDQFPSVTLSLLDIAGATTGLEIMISGMAFLAGWYATTLVFSVFGGGK